jgi:hypothetical protein
MSFAMTSSIFVGAYEVKANEVQYKCSATSFVDTCTIKLPLASSLRKTVSGTDDIGGRRRTVFAEGDRVEVSLGYDRDDYLCFRGFVARINYAVPLELECEGYSYQIKNKVLNKSYKKTTIKEILSDLCAGTDIVLSGAVPDADVDNVSFKNAPGLKVLEWLQKELLCAVYFDFDQLYAGPSLYAPGKPSASLRIGWNTADDKELKKRQSQDLEINIIEKDSAGAVKRVKGESSKYSGSKEVKVRAGLPAGFVATLRNELQAAQDYSGYEGSLTAFMLPHFDKGYGCMVEDRRFPERSGRYIVETVEGSFGMGGGRQKLALKYYGN